VGVPFQKENETPLGPKARGEENGEEVSPSHPTLQVWESIVSSPSAVRGQAPAKNGFIVVLISAMTANSSPFHPKKRSTVPLSPKSGGAVNNAYASTE